MQSETKLIKKYKTCSTCGLHKVYAKNVCEKCYGKLPHQRERSNKYAREWRSKNKEHVSKWKRNHYIKNREKILAQQKVSISKNIDKIRKKAKDNYWANRNEIRKKQNAYVRLNREKINTQQREYYHKNKNTQGYKEKAAIRSKKWAKENRDRVRELDRKYQKKRRETDPLFKIRTNISRHIRKVLRDSNGYKRNSIWTVLPYTPDKLKSHLESQFKNGWAWDNYGIAWNIDHIIPQSKLLFDTIDHPNFIKCWGLNNLRPLDCSENFRKQDKLITI